ncbi:5-formyl-3-hydroxy-2-methylpyridine 4-carboxylate 5-dehydrogenase [Chachezhania antarctica]|uniref:5-formyl-3-hydroxy-2-methylpyridine 4-carboxylate 5-dehydrogenase n=1 Tax=Chachezhania antarctica TaxID=2340860 RepID=UPI000EAC2F66|nr:5-formyl-3-hydroxy-2-methylpyridine 4-carboxylate 5-dehydrogenase [Chachezhania antarctica]|tara:strand:- start:779 stop:1693 length:915 start_codon:yes stop_codon:yes gene_type:complete
MRIAVIGLGSMGPGMAARMARAGHDVTAFDISAAAVEKAKGMLPMIGGALDGLGIADQGGSLTFPATLEDTVTGAGLVIENVPEDEAIKAALYADLGPLMGPDTVLASDTSGIPITMLQAHAPVAERFVGMHWSNPPHIVPMIEVIGGEETSTATVDVIRDLIRGMDLIPVVLKRDLPGFVENRVLYALLRECVDLVEQGVVSPEDLDTVVKWGIGYKLSVVGPMRLLDMAGLDIYSSVASFLNAELCDRDDVSPMISEETAKGRLGMKTGGGLFDYSPEELKDLPRDRGARLVAVRRVLEARE